MTSDDQEKIRVSQFQKQLEDDAKARQSTKAQSSHGLRGKPAVLIALIAATLVLVFINLAVPFSSTAPTAREKMPPDESPQATSSLVVSPQSQQTSKLAPEGALITAQRDKALNALEALNTQWTVLDAMSPSLWASEAFVAARGLYAEGDSAYAADDFVTAALIYEQSLNATMQLLDTAEEVFKASLQRGADHLEKRDYTAAQESFHIALAIAPAHIDATAGLNSATHGAAVDRLMVKARFHKETNNFTEAGAVLKEAIALDPTRMDAKNLLNELGRDEGQYRLARLISTANENLSAQHFDEAIRLFNQALKLAPTHPEALAGKELALKEKKSHTLATYRVDGIRAEAQENWSKAITAYRGALSLDNKAHFAAEGLKRATSYKSLSDEMAIYLDKPKRVSSPAVFSAANTLFVTIAAMENAPSTLTSQNAKLGDILDAMQTPVPVRVMSDNRSLVSIQKIGDLGRFQDKTINLRAGRYVFIAKRTGYADKRVVIDIPADATSMLLKVICDEKI